MRAGFMVNDDACGFGGGSGLQAKLTRNCWDGTQSGAGQAPAKPWLLAAALS